MAEAHGDNEDRRVASLIQPATPRQLKFIQAIAREKGMTDDMVSGHADRIYGKTVGEIDRHEASAFIEWLQARVFLTEPNE
jgi:hypothetical protein